MQLSVKTVPTLLELTEVSNYKNSLVVKHYAGMNLQRALSAPSKSVGIISKENEEGVKRAIANLFIGTSMYFDNELSFKKANVLSEEILACYEYRQLKLEDVLAICIEIKESDIFKLTPARIIRHISNYTERRLKQSIHNSIQLTQDSKSGDADIDKRIKKSIRHIERSNLEVVKGRLYTSKYYK